MICKDCGEKDMRYDEHEKSYHCNNCGSRNIGTYEEMDKTVIDSFEKVMLAIPLALADG